MDLPRNGGCACGAVRYRLTSDPLFTHCCHCLNCQRQTGSAFVVNLLIEADRVEVLAGEPTPVDVPRDDGSTQRVYRTRIPSRSASPSFADESLLSAAWTAHAKEVAPAARFATG